MHKGHAQEEHEYAAEQVGGTHPGPSIEVLCLRGGWKQGGWLGPLCLSPGCAPAMGVRQPWLFILPGHNRELLRQGDAVGHFIHSSASTAVALLLAAALSHLLLRGQPCPAWRSVSVLTPSGRVLPCGWGWSLPSGAALGASHLPQLSNLPSDSPSVSDGQ